MFDPYQVLQVSRTASDAEIKKAYRNLSRKYHPDANINNPNKAQAEEKFKEIQAAYNQIMDERQNGSSAFHSNNSYYNNYNSSYYSQESKELFTAATYINNRQFGAAMQVLQSIPEESRHGKWYFFAAVASQGLGQINMANEYIARAIALEPSNIQYRQFYQSLNSSSWYTSSSRAYGYSTPFSGVFRWGILMVLLNFILNFICCGC